MVTQRTGWLIAILLTLILALASCTMVITPEPSGVGPAAATPAAEEEATAEPAAPPPRKPRRRKVAAPETSPEPEPDIPGDDEV